MFVLNIIKDNHDEKKQVESEALQQKLITQAIDSTYKNSIKASNEALAKYSLSIADSFRSVASTIKSTEKKSYLYLAPQDSLSPVYMTVENGIKKLHTRFRSNNGTSYNIFLDYIIIDRQYKILLMEPVALNDVPENLLMTLHTVLTPEVQSVLATYDNTIIFYTGKYSNDPFNKEIFKFNEAVSFDFKNKKFINGEKMNFNTLKEELKIFNPDLGLPF